MLKIQDAICHRNMLWDKVTQEHFVAHLYVHDVHQPQPKSIKHFFSSIKCHQSSDLVA